MNEAILKKYLTKERLAVAEAFDYYKSKDDECNCIIVIMEARATKGLTTLLQTDNSHVCECGPCVVPRYIDLGLELVL